MEAAGLAAGPGPLPGGSGLERQVHTLLISPTSKKSCFLLWNML